MAVERRTPTPPGLYWQDFFDPPVGQASIPAFQAWLKENADIVKVRSTTWHGPGKNPIKEFVSGALTTSIPGLTLLADALPDVGQSRLFVVFEVLKPVFWPATKFGFPSIVEGQTVNSALNQDAPPDPQPNTADVLADIVSPDNLKKGIQGASKYALAIGAVAAILGLGYLAVITKPIRKAIL